MTPYSLEEIFVTKPIFPSLDNINSHLVEIWNKGILTNNGPKCLELERRLVDYLECEHFCAFNNGTNALIAAIQALGLKGDVIVTPFTFAATVHALHYCNLRPIFVDIHPKTLSIDPERIESAITPETTGILGVHVYGIPSDVTRIQDIADKYKLKVVYDGAHSFNTKINGVPIHKFGDATVLSFHATKLFHSVEGGGVIVKNFEDLKKLRLVRNFGIENEETVSTIGFNGKLNEIQAAIGLAVIDVLDDEKSARALVSDIYNKSLSDLDGIDIAHIHNINNDSFQYYCIKVKDTCNVSRDQLYNELKDYKINTRKYFFPLCSNFDCYIASPSASRSNLPVANAMCNQVLCLPFYGELGIAGANRVSNAIRAVVSR